MAKAPSDNIYICDCWLFQHQQGISVAAVEVS